MSEDRIRILEDGRELALVAISQFPHNKALLAAYSDLGIEYYRRIGSYEYFDEAMNYLRIAEEALGDPDLTRMVARYTRRLQGQPFEPVETE